MLGNSILNNGGKIMSRESRGFAEQAKNALIILEKTYELRKRGEEINAALTSLKHAQNLSYKDITVINNLKCVESHLKKELKRCVEEHNSLCLKSQQL